MHSMVSIEEASRANGQQDTSVMQSTQDRPLREVRALLRIAGEFVSPAEGVARNFLQQSLRLELLPGFRPHFLCFADHCSANRIAPDIDSSATAVKKPVNRPDQSDPFKR